VNAETVPPGTPGGLDSFIEQFRADDCPNTHTPWLKGIDIRAGIVVFFRPRCKLWSCPVCGPINATLWAWRADAGARLLGKEHPLAFITLTSHEKLAANASLRVLPSAWGKLQDRLRRAASGQYLIVPELHKNGRVHLHGLFTHGLKKKWFKDNARECGMGYQVDSQEVISLGGVAAYVTKYLTKSIVEPQFAKGFRRVRTTRNWPKLPEKIPRDGLSFVLFEHDETLQDAAREARAHGYEVVIAGSKSGWKLLDAIDETDQLHIDDE